MKRYGSNAGMDEETREQVVALLTRIGMMAEDLSAIALGAAVSSDEELARLLGVTRRMARAIQVLGEEVGSIFDKLRR